MFLKSNSQQTSITTREKTLVFGQQSVTSCAPAETDDSWAAIVGVLGYSGSFLIAIHSATHITDIPYPIHRVSNARVSPLGVGAATCDALEKLVNSLELYYSPTHAINARFGSQGDERFIWNAHLQTTDFFVPVICGFVRVYTSSAFTYCLISRTSRYRQGLLFNKGARYHRRGCDEDGNVANYVETEQIVVGQNLDLSSFVMIRGSIPLTWTQSPDVAYKPPIHIARDRKGFSRHFKDMAKYGQITVINLINSHGYESCLLSEFSNQLSGNALE